MTYRDIRIDNSPMQGGVLPPQPSGPPQDVRDMRVLTVTGEGKSLTLDDLLETGKTEVLRFPLGEQIQSLDEIKLENHNTLRTIHISSIKVLDPAQRSDFRPVHPLSQAEDAEIEIDGVRVVRDTNQLSDAIPGIELMVLDSSPEVLKVTIGPDKKKIKDSIIDYLVNYNRLMGELLVLTSLRPKKDSPLVEREQSPIIQAAVYHTEEERKTAAKNLGRYQGESFLNQIKNKLQLLMMNPYSSKDTRFSLLAEIGISGFQAGAQDLTQRRGYLNLDEKKLDEALDIDVSSVRKLFGMDTSGDLVMDFGAAYSVGELLKPSIQLGGLNAGRISSFDKQMQIKDQEIDNYKKYLARYEAELKRKYRIMESTLNSMENNSSRIENLNRTK